MSCTVLLKKNLFNGMTLCRKHNTDILIPVQVLFILRIDEYKSLIDAIHIKKYPCNICIKRISGNAIHINI